MVGDAELMPAVETGWTEAVGWAFGPAPTELIGSAMFPR